MRPLILAAPDMDSEPELVAAAALHGVVVARRSFDAADLLAAAAADTSMAVAVSAGVPRLSGDLIGRIIADDRAVIGIAGNDEDERQLVAWKVSCIIRHHGDPVETMAQIAGAMESGDSPMASSALSLRGTGAHDPSAPDERPGEDPRPHRLVAVWGTTGAPGRTTTALAVAQSLARCGYEVCIVDADTYAPSMVAQVAVNADTSGLVVACRQAENGTLNRRTILSAASQVSDRLWLLGGLARAERWPDLREAALRTVWSVAREAFDIVIVDIGACIEQEGAVAHLAGSPLLSSRRNAAAVTALEASDRVLATARSSALGLTRLLNELPAVTRVNEDAAVTLVLTGRQGMLSTTSVSDRLLRQLGVRAPVARIPRDPERLERAIRDGITPYEAASRRERRMLAALAKGLAA